MINYVSNWKSRTLWIVLFSFIIVIGYLVIFTVIQYDLNKKAFILSMAGHDVPVTFSTTLQLFRIGDILSAVLLLAGTLIGGNKLRTIAEYLAKNKENQ